MTILITAPHAKCNEDDLRLHMCDAISKEISYLIYIKLISIGINSKLFISNTRKIEYNMNKLRARKTKYRKKITHYMKRDPLYLFDIHSFHDNTTYEILVIDQFKLLPDYVENLIKYMKDKKININVLYSLRNDILCEARSYNIRSVLLNFNEKLEQERITYIVEILVKWIQINKNSLLTKI